MDEWRNTNTATIRCAVCGGPDGDGNGCEFCPAVETMDVAELQQMSSLSLRTLIAVEREHGRAFGPLAEAARLLLNVRGETL